MNNQRIIPVEYLATYNAAKKAELELDDDSEVETEEREPETLRSAQ